jgi:hypothetical protein
VAAEAWACAAALARCVVAGPALTAAVKGWFFWSVLDRGWYATPRQDGLLL